MLRFEYDRCARLPPPRRRDRHALDARGLCALLAAHGCVGKDNATPIPRQTPLVCNGAPPLTLLTAYPDSPGCDVYLHVRLMDQPARALYANNGYEARFSAPSAFAFRSNTLHACALMLCADCVTAQVVATDHFAVFRGERRTSLMRKRLAASPEAMAAAAARDAAVAARAAAAAASVTEAAEQEEEDGEETAASPVPI